MSDYSTFSVRKLWPVITLVLTLAWASSCEQGGPDGPEIPHFDKIVHFFFRTDGNALLSMHSWNAVVGYSVVSSIGVSVSLRSG